MSSIGMIFKADRQIHTLPADWVPCPLGPRNFVEQVVSAAMQTAQGEISTLCVNVENEGECAYPRVISISGVWGETEMKAIKSICSLLDARFYDAELADFIELQVSWWAAGHRPLRVERGLSTQARIHDSSASTLRRMRSETMEPEHCRCQARAAVIGHRQSMNRACFVCTRPSCSVMMHMCRAIGNNPRNVTNTDCAPSGAVYSLDWDGSAFDAAMRRASSAHGWPIGVLAQKRAASALLSRLRSAAPNTSARNSKATRTMASNSRRKVRTYQS